jgi:TonB family protein
VSRAIQLLAAAVVLGTALTAQVSEPSLSSYQNPPYPALARAARIQGEVQIDFAIDGSGAPIEITVVSGHPLLANASVENLRTWRFTPLVGSNQPGKTYRTVFQYSLSDDVQDGPYDVSKEQIQMESFQVVRIISAPWSRSNVHTEACSPPNTAPPESPASEDDFVVLARSGCYGPCPVYSVTVVGNGEITWDGKMFVEARGSKQSRIPPERARALIDLFRTADVWSLCRSYSQSITDSSAAEITISLGGQIKRVHDYAESSPPWFRDLQLAVDAAADTHLWRHGDSRDEPLGNILADTYLPKPGVTPLMKAAARGDGDALRTLLTDGADVTAVDASGWTALMYGAANWTPSNAVEILLAAGADPNHASLIGDTALMAFALTGHFEEDLAKAGARVNSQNHEGVTTLMILATHADPEEIQTALRAGANGSLKDAQGRTALDYLEAANCYRSPIRGREEFLDAGERSCTAFERDDYRASRKLLRTALRNRTRR